ncbi:MAG: PAS domain S-box protein [Theionarchaea archaeon]|nr:PAS domain S-box protein [Theionarchaea archaeon]
MTKVNPKPHETPFVERILQSESVKKAAELLLGEVVHYTDSQSAGFFLVVPEIQLVCFQGEKPQGKLTVKIQNELLVHRQITFSKKGFQAAFPLIYDKEIFGVLELSWKNEPPQGGIDSIESLCLQNSAAIGAVRRFEQARENILKHNEFLSNVLESLAYPLYVIDAHNYTVVMANAAAVLDRLSEHKPCYELIHKRNNQCSTDICPIEEVKKTKKPVKTEYIYYEDGNEKAVEVHAYPIFDSNGRITQVVEYFVDITERKKAEKALKKSEERYRAVVEDQTELICRFLPDGTLTFVNEAYCRYFGKNREDLVGKSFMPLIPEEDREWAERHLSSLNPENPVGTIEHRVFVLGGEIRWQQWTDRALFDEHGQLIGFQSVGRDITERKKMEEEIKNYAKGLEKKVLERTEELMRANQLKSEFLASISHEFRTPLNSILSFAELLLLGIDGPVNAQQKEDLEMIRESGGDLLELVNNLLDLSKIEAGRIELRVEPVDPAEVIDAVTSQLLMKAAEKRLSLTTDIAQDVPPVTADESRLKQIVRNLLENALKFTEEGGVNVGAYYRNGEVVFWVKDTGCGIAEEDQKIIFDKFRQARKGTEKSGGTGLGLSVARELVELHGGRIWVKSEPGKGSTFSFSIPAAS